MKQPTELREKLDEILAQVGTDADTAVELAGEFKATVSTKPINYSDLYRLVGEMDRTVGNIRGSLMRLKGANDVVASIRRS